MQRAKNVKSEFWFKKVLFDFTPLKWSFGSKEPILNTISHFVHVYRDWRIGPFRITWQDEVTLEVEPTSQTKREWFVNWIAQRKKEANK